MPDKREYPTAEALEIANRLVKMGNYVGVAETPGLISALEKVDAGENAADNVAFLHARALLSEQEDQRGRYLHARQRLTQHFDVVQVALRSNTKSIPNVLEARLRFSLRFAITLHRSADHKGALKIVATCQECFNRFETTYGSLDQPEYRDLRDLVPLFRYWEGRFRLHQQQYEEALESFLEAMRLVASNLDLYLTAEGIPRVGDEGEPDDVRAAIKSAHYRTGSSLAFGVAEIYQRQGRIKDAIEVLVPALSLLRPTSDMYRYGFALLMLGSLERVAGENDLPRLAKAEERLHAALNYFQTKKEKDDHQQLGDHEHALYEAWADHELAQLCLAQFRAYATADQSSKQAEALAKATSWIEEAEVHRVKAKKALGDVEGVSYGGMPLSHAISLAESHLAFYGQAYQDAVRIASDVIYRATKEECRPSHIAGLLARGDAYLEHFCGSGADLARDEASLAVADFEAVRRMARDDLKSLAYANLRLAYLELARRDVRSARHYLQEYRNSKTIEDGRVRILADYVEALITRSDIFVLDIKDIAARQRPGLSLYQEMEERLRDYCARQAESWGTGKNWTKDAAERLGIGRATIFKWRKLRDKWISDPDGSDR